MIGCYGLGEESVGKKIVLLVVGHTWFETKELLSFVLPAHSFPLYS